MPNYPVHMVRHPWSARFIPTSYMLPGQWPQSQSNELILSMEVAEYEEKLNEIRKTNINLITIGKTTVENDREEFDNEAEGDDGDNAEASEGDDFEQEAG